MASSTTVAPAINLDALQSRLQRAMTAEGYLDLTPGLLPAGDLATFTENAPNGRFRLLKPALTWSDDGTNRCLNLTGILADPWTLPQIAGAQISAIEIKAQFTKARPSVPIPPQLLVTAARLTLAGAVYPVAGSLTPGGKLLRLTVAKGDPAARTSLTGLVTVLANPAAVAQVTATQVPAGVVALNAVAITTGELCFGLTPDLDTTIALTAACDGDWAIVGDGRLTLRQLGVTLTVARGPSANVASSQSSCSLVYRAVTDFCGRPVAVTVTPMPTGRWSLSLAAANGTTLPGLNDIAGFIGGDALRGTVRTGLDSLRLGDITVDAASVDVDMARRTLTSLLVGGRIGFAGAMLQASVQLPDFRFQATLPPAAAGGPAATISLDRAAAQCLGEAAGLPALTVDALTLTAQPAAGTYDVSMTTAQAWNWAVGGAGGPVLTLRNVKASLSCKPGSAGGRLSARTTLGGVDLDLGADYLGAGKGWYFSGTTAVPGGTDLGAALRDVAGKLGGDFPTSLLTAIGTMTISSLAMMADTKSGSFQFGADVALSGGLPLGDASYALKTRAVITSATDPASKRRGYAGHLEADFPIDAATFVLSYDFGPSPSVVTGRWRDETGRVSIGVGDVMRALNIGAVLPIPSGIDFGLKAAAFEYRAAQGQFALSAESSLFGDAFLTIAKDGRGKWGAVFGVELPGAARLSDIPGIGSSFKAADSLKFNRLSVMLASTSFTDYTPPELPELPAAADTGPFPRRLTDGRTTTPQAAGAKFPLPAGLSLAATIDFAASGSGDMALRNLRGLIGADRLLMLATAGPAGVVLSATLSGSVAIPTGTGGNLTLSNPTVSLNMGALPVYQMSGQIAFPVFGKRVEATARLVVAPTQAQVAVSVSTPTGSLPSPPGIKGLRLQQFGVMMGVFFEPPGLDLGIQGQFQVGTSKAPRSDQFALVLQMVGEVPNILYLSFYLDRMDLGQLVTMFTDRPPPDFVRSMEIVKASQLSFHWCEQPVVLPDGSTALPGFAVSANVAILGLTGHAELSIADAEDVFGTVELMPIDLKGVLRIAGDGVGRTRTWQQRDGAWAEVSNNAIVRQSPPLPTRQEVVVPPGGPVVAINCDHSPFLLANWCVSLFDLVNQTVDVAVDATGFRFALTYNVAGIEQFDLSCTLKDGLNFAAGADCRFGVDTTVGPIHVAGVPVGNLHVQSMVAAHIDVAISQAQFTLKLGGGFGFMGLNIPLPTLSLSEAPASLAELPPRVAKLIADFADDLFKTLFRDASAWARMVANGIITGVTEMGVVLKQAYKLTAEAAAAVLKGAGYAAADVANQLKQGYGLAAEATATALKAAGYAATDVVAALKQGYAIGADAAAVALKAAGYTATEAVAALKQGYGIAAGAAAVALKGAGYAVNEVTNALKQGYGIAADALTVALKGAGYTANEVANALKGAGFAAIDVAKQLKQAYELTADAMAAALKGAGYAATETAAALKQSYVIAAAALATVLKSIGYAATDTAAALKQSYGIAADAAVVILKGAGYVANDVAKVLKGAGYGAADAARQLKQAYMLTADTMSAALKAGGYVATDTISALRQSYGVAANAAAAALKAGGYAIMDIVAALKPNYGIAIDAAVTLLKAVGYNVNDVAGALKGAGYAAADVAKLLKPGYGLAADTTAAALRAAGYAAADTVAALKQHYGIAADAALVILKGAGYAASDVAGALKRLGFQAGRVAKQLLQVYGLAADATAAALKAAGYAATEAVAALGQCYDITVDAAAIALKGAGYAAFDTFAALNQGYGLAADTLTVALKGAGYTAEEVAGTLKRMGHLTVELAGLLAQVYGLGAGAAATVLKSVGYAATEIFVALGQNYGIAADVVVNALKSAGYAVNDVAGALKGAGYAATEVASLLKPGFGLAADAAATVLKSAGYAATDAVAALKQSYGVAATTAAVMLRAAGYAVTDIGAALNQGYGLAADTLTGALKSAGYAASDMANALKGAGYAVTDVAKQLLQGCGLSTVGITTALKAAGYAATDAATGLMQACGIVADAAPIFLKIAGYTATEAAAAVNKGYGMAADAAAAALKGAGYALADIATGLKQGYELTADATATALKATGFTVGFIATALKQSYGIAADATAAALKGAGYAAADAASALSESYGIAADAAAAALKAAGYGMTDIIGALQQRFGLAADTLMVALKDAGFAAIEVATALNRTGYPAMLVANMLRQGYGQASETAAAVLKTAGYAANEVAQALNYGYGLPAYATATIMKGLDYSVNEVGGAINIVYGNTADVASQVLRSAGYTAEQTGNYVLGTFNLAPDALNSTLSKAGYAAEEIGSYFGTLGEEFTDAMKDVGDALNPANWFR